MHFLKKSNFQRCNEISRVRLPIPLCTLFQNTKIFSGFLTFLNWVNWMYFQNFITEWTELITVKLTFQGSFYIFCTFCFTNNNIIKIRIFEITIELERFLCQFFISFSKLVKCFFKDWFNFPVCSILFIHSLNGWNSLVWSDPWITWIMNFSMPSSKSQF